MTETQKACSPGPAAHDHRRCIATALREAEDLCRARAVNLTATRRRVLELVWQGHEPVKAYQIINNFRAGHQATKPPTVYRALDFLMENGLVHRIESLNAFVGCTRPENRHQADFFICTACHRVDEIDSGKIAATFEKLARQQNFTISHKTVEVYGLCRACHEKTGEQFHA
ncbi:MAG: transcriptional repressor [Proteobacteria bacterium]|nr:transcriptional repressor [Pseudomonadota bacterium]